MQSRLQKDPGVQGYNISPRTENALSHFYNEPIVLFNLKNNFCLLALLKPVSNTPTEIDFFKWRIYKDFINGWGGGGIH